MDAIKILVLAIFQGIGEFLPISSSGHLLVLGSLLFGDSKSLDDGDLLTLNILLHAGTLFSILIYFRRQIWDALTKDRRALGLVVVGSIPTVVIAIAILKFADFLTEDLLTAGFGFIVTGVVLLKFFNENKKTRREAYLEEIEKLNDDKKDGGTKKIDDEFDLYGKEPATKSLQAMTWLDALVVGIAQGIAVLPGVSRSGSTIAAGVWRKLNRETAATFSFLLSIPVIAGSALLETVKIVKDFNEQGRELNIFGDPQLSLYVFGAFISFLVGLVSLVYLMRLLKSGKVRYFAYWLFVLGPIVVVWQVIVRVLGLG